MVPNPVPAVLAKAVVGVFIAFVTAGSPDVQALPACDSLSDVVAGCSGTVGAVMAGVLTTIPGAPTWFNALLALGVNGLLVWWLIAWLTELVPL